MRAITFLLAAPGFGFLIPVAPAQSVTPPPGLVSWWDADSLSGATATDIQDGNDGTLLSNATTAAGKVGQAFGFDGSGDAVSIGNPMNLHLQDLTIEAWIKRADANATTLDPVPGPEGGILAFGTNAPGFVLQPDGELVFTKIGVSGVFSGSLRVSDTDWHHVGVTKSGSAVVFYVDGMAGAAPAYDPGFTFTTNGTIGARGDNLGQSFWGLIDEVSIYNRALSASEIQGIFNAGSSGKSKIAGTYQQFGVGCAGSVGVPILDAAPGSLPKMDSTFTLQLSNLPAGKAAFFIIGFSNTDWAGIPLPGDLSVFGLPGCTVYVSVDVAFPAANFTGMSQFPLAIPSDPFLLGLSFFTQGLVLDPGVNFFGAVVTNGGEGVVGHR